METNKKCILFGQIKDAQSSCHEIIFNIGADLEIIHALLVEKNYKGTEQTICDLKRYLARILADSKVRGPFEKVH